MKSDEKPKVGTSKVVGTKPPQRGAMVEAGPEVKKDFREHDRPTAKRNEKGELEQDDDSAS